MSATHRCLLVNELFRTISDELCSDGRTGRDALAQLSRTCKTMHEAVTPVLWENMTSLVPLLKLLPRDTWCEGKDASGRTTFQIHTPDRLRWGRFQFYAEHVRRLVWCHCDDVSPFALVAVAASWPGEGYLLPRLRNLRWWETRATHFPFVHNLLSPTIRCLDIKVSTVESKLLKELFDNATKNCNRVTILRIHTDSLYDQMPVHTAEVDNALARYLRSTTDLGVFFAEMHLSASCMEALAELPKLTGAEIWALQGDMDTLVARIRHYQGTAADSHRFRALSILSMKVDRLDDNTKSFLQSIESDSLDSVKIHMHMSIDTLIAEQHLEILARGPSRATLAYLEIEFECFGGYSVLPVPCIDLAQLLRPLLPLPQMRKLSVHAEGLAVTPRVLRDIANAWKDLTTLSLVSCGIRRGVDETSPTLEDLVPLARACPALHQLQLHVDASAVPCPAEIDRMLPEPTQCALLSFHVLQAPITDPERVAAFLGRTFPHLRELTEYSAVSLLPEVQIKWEADWDVVREILQIKTESAPE
ncbi:hypothetical protein BD413DRAFT_467700 [Trametes elegans]|nr:hypothetical protein BD413DRAFT_467700 [Trametes elegans]